MGLAIFFFGLMIFPFIGITAAVIMIFFSRNKTREERGYWPLRVFPLILIIVSLPYLIMDVMAVIAMFMR